MMGVEWGGVMIGVVGLVVMMMMMMMIVWVGLMMVD